MKLSEFIHNHVYPVNVAIVNHFYLEAANVARQKGQDEALKECLRVLICVIANWGKEVDGGDIELDEIKPYYNDTWHYNRYWGCVLSKSMEGHHVGDAKNFNDGLREMLTMIYILMVTMKREEDKIKWEDLL